MNYRKLKYKIAQSCKGDLKEYFNKIDLVNKMIMRKKVDILEKSLHKNVY